MIVSAFLGWSRWKKNYGPRHYEHNIFDPYDAHASLRGVQPSGKVLVVDSTLTTDTQGFLVATVRIRCGIPGAEPVETVHEFHYTLGDSA